MPQPRTNPNPPRFVCPMLPATSGQDISDPCLTLDKAESHHARHVLRLSVGDPVVLFDGRGSIATAHVDSFAGQRVVCRIEQISHEPATEPRLTVASAVPKGPRADAMIDQLSQLGVDCFIPLKCERSVAVPKDSKVEKFTRAVVESAKQCGRTWLMDVEEPKLPEDVWSDSGYDLKLLAAPQGRVMRDLADRLRTSRHVLALIGPEGGWTEQELTSANEAGCVPWRIAPHILRIETAAITAAAILRQPLAE